jgi:exocyst complex component 3
MWTPGAIDFFRILNEQVAVVAEVNQDAMLLRVGQVRKGWSLDGVFCCCPC